MLSAHLAHMNIIKNDLCRLLSFRSMEKLEYPSSATSHSKLLFFDIAGNTYNVLGMYADFYIMFLGIGIHK